MDTPTQSQSAAVAELYSLLRQSREILPPTRPLETDRPAHIRAFRAAYPEPITGYHLERGPISLSLKGAIRAAIRQIRRYIYYHPGDYQRVPLGQIAAETLAFYQLGEANRRSLVSALSAYLENLIPELDEAEDIRAAVWSR